MKKKDKKDKKSSRKENNIFKTKLKKKTIYVLEVVLNNLNSYDFNQINLIISNSKTFLPDFTQFFINEYTENPKRFTIKDLRKSVYQYEKLGSNLQQAKFIKAGVFSKGAKIYDTMTNNSRDTNCTFYIRFFVD